MPVTGGGPGGPGGTLGGGNQGHSLESKSRRCRGRRAAGPPGWPTSAAERITPRTRAHAGARMHTRRGRSSNCRQVSSRRAAGRRQPRLAGRMQNKQIVHHEPRLESTRHCPAGPDRGEERSADRETKTTKKRLLKKRKEEDGGNASSRGRTRTEENVKQGKKKRSGKRNAKLKAYGVIKPQPGRGTLGFHGRTATGQCGTAPAWLSVMRFNEVGGERSERRAGSVISHHEKRGRG